MIKMKAPLEPNKKVILNAIFTLKEEGFKLTQDGLTLLLRGEKELKELSFSSAYAYLPSLSSKKIKNRIQYLINHGYIYREYNKALDVHFLTLTGKAFDLDLRRLAKKEVKEVEERIYFSKI